jgi:hypothetical protein
MSNVTRMETRLDSVTIYSRQRRHHKDVIGASSKPKTRIANFLFPNCALNLVS